MNPNFPHDLSIEPSNPSSALRHFTSKNSASDSEAIVFENGSLVSSQKTDIESYGIAGRIWEASYATSIFIDPPFDWEFDPQCSISGGNGAVLELGSGTGFLGFKLARILSKRQSCVAHEPRTLVLTDMKDVCPLLERNQRQEVGLAENLSGVHLVVRPLNWGNSEHGYSIAEELVSAAAPNQRDGLLSHVVCSDLIYFPELFAPLLRTLLQLSSPPFSTAVQPVQIIISCTFDMIRSPTKEIPFWSALGAWFDFSPVLARRKSVSPAHWERFGSHEEGTTFIFVATRKPESLTRIVPDDSQLMSSVDGTFETLLLMNMSSEE